MPQWGKKYSQNTSEKGLRSRILKKQQTLFPLNKKANRLIKNWAKDWERPFTNEGKKRQMSTRKGAQHP